ncbi:LysM domain/BON superfamily protein [Planctomycetes bacterium Pla163]|uniref:LysM domain/BON superfamily protein n=1 Tax=Rohdeia mirabilis TaxID=2528008 RepID=A0A518CYW9_9BACT|nr:LysM domain/BON superfamily protein [Planctomycetes bacterium Pla163]
MGSFEKLVVLTVIFLASVVLVVSFQTPVESAGDRTAALDRTTAAVAPIGGSNAVDDRAGASSATPSAGTNPFATGSSRGDERGALLSATGTTEAAAERGADVAPTPAVIANGYPPLRDGVQGLTEHPSQVGAYIYRVRANDVSWLVLAERFYGNGAYAEVLRRDNEAVGPPQAGMEILVLSSSFAGRTAARTETFEPRAPGRPAPRTPKTGPDGAPVQDVADAPSGSTFRTHVVRSGETLTGIAFAYYGRASLWTRIFDANRDVLPNENDLKIGMQLRIP